VRLHELPGRALAADQLQIFFSEKSRKRRRPLLRPFIVQEMAVTAGALNGGAEENLGRVGGGLHRPHVRVVQHIARRMVRHRRVEQLLHERVVRLVGVEAVEDPLAVVAVRANAALMQTV
jgi:hypothetical protein